MDTKEGGDVRTRCSIGWSSLVLLLVALGACSRHKNRVVSESPAGSGSTASAYEKLAKQFEQPDEFEKMVKGQNDPSWTESFKEMKASLVKHVTPQPKVVDKKSDPISLASGIPKLGPEVYYSAGLLAEERQKPDRALKEYQRALAAEPNYLPALLAVARLFDRNGQRAAALKVLQDARKAHPKHPAPLNAMGLMAAQQGDLAQAEQLLQQAVQRAPKDVRYRNNLASVQVKQHRVEAAWKTLAAVHSPAVAHYNVAFLLYHNGQPSEALGQLEQALARQPDLKAALALKKQLQLAATIARRPASNTTPPTSGQEVAYPSTTSPPATSPPATSPSTTVPAGGTGQPRHLPVTR